MLWSPLNCERCDVPAEVVTFRAVHSGGCLGRCRPRARMSLGRRDVGEATHPRQCAGVGRAHRSDRRGGAARVRCSPSGKSSPRTKASAPTERMHHLSMIGCAQDPLPPVRRRGRMGRCRQSPPAKVTTSTKVSGLSPVVNLERHLPGRDGWGSMACRGTSTFASCGIGDARSTPMR
jgi:hypothetical protein